MLKEIIRFVLLHLDYLKQCTDLFSIKHYDFRSTFFLLNMSCTYTVLKVYLP